jgi:hypothetical protein
MNKRSKDKNANEDKLLKNYAFADSSASEALLL